MVIVNQDRDWIFNFDNTTSIGIDEENTLKVISIAGKWNILGSYRTRERAKEVLQEIVKAYKGKILIQIQGQVPDNVMEEINEKNKNDAVYYDLRSEVKQLTKVIYEMPQE